MICPQCSAKNPDDAFFCGECGAQMQSLVSPPAGPVEVSGEIEIDPLLGDPADEVPAASRDEPLPAPPPAQGIPIPPPAHGAPAPPTDPLAPGAGIAPPPGAVQGQPPAQQVPPSPGPGLGAVPASQPPPPPQYQGYPPIPGYGQAMPPDGNTSGMGQNYPVPPEASGWTFAGCIPFGLFAFFNGSVIWGLVSVPGGMIPYIGAIATLAYFIYIGIQGRELAWRSRRFNSIQEYSETMRAWNMWGLIMVGVNVALGIGFFFLYVLFFAAILATGP